MSVIVYAEKDWSFLNLASALAGIEYQHIVGYDDPLFESARSEMKEWLKTIDLAITCEPHIEGWRRLYPHIKGKIPILALQQGMYWDDKPAKKADWLFDKFMVWGEQMRECCLMNGLPEDRILVTGNPGFDQFFGAHPTDDGYTLILASRFESTSKKFSDCIISEKKIIIQPHPADDLRPPSLRPNTFSLIRSAHNVAFSYTGCGIAAMIMKKPCYVIPGRTRSYEKSPSYNAGRFVSDNDDFVRWSVTGPGSTGRVKKVIREYI